MTTPTRPQLNAEKSLGGYTQRHARKLYIGELGNNSGVVDDTARTTSGQDFVFVRLNQDANQVVSALAATSFPHVADIIVILELVERKGAPYYQVLGIAPNIVYSTATATWSGVPGEHANQHERRDRGAGGFDPLDVYTRALVNLRARAQTTPDLTLHVERGFYIFTSVKEYAGGNSPAFVPPVTVSSQRWDLLYLGNDDALHVVSGAAVVGFGTPAYPACPINAIPLAYVLLRTAQTSILEADITDARVLWTAMEPAVPVLPYIVPAPDGGAGTEVSPYTDSTDSAAGIQTALNTAGAGRGGWVMCESKRYNITAAGGLTLATPALRLSGAAPAFNIDPNGEAEGISGTKLYLTGDGIGLGQAAQKRGRLVLEDLYLWGNVGANKAAIWVVDDVDQPSIRRISIGGNWTYGIYINNVMDAGHVLDVTLCGGKHGIYLGSSSIISYTEFVDCVMADNDGYGFYADPTGVNAANRWARLVGCLFTRCAHQVATAASANVYWGLSEGVVDSCVSRDAGHENGGATRANIDGLIVDGHRNIISGNQLIDNSGYGIRIKGDNNIVIGNLFSNNTGGSIIIEAGADNNVIIQPGVTVTDNGTGTIILDTVNLSLYQLLTGKNAANGYAGLDAGTLLATAEMGTGVADATTYLRGDRTWQVPPTGGGGSAHIHGLARWIADGSTSTFDLPDIAEYVDSVTNGGHDVDALTYTLSADGAQIIFDSAPTAANILQCNYVLMGA